MTIPSIGDLRQHFLTSRNTNLIKTELNTLVQELTTGQASDLTEHLGAGQTKLAGLDRQLKMLSQFSQANTETSQLLSLMQTALGNVDQLRESSSNTLLKINGSSLSFQIDDAGRSAMAGFEGTVQSLNMRSGDRSIFGGNDFDQNALAAPSDMIDALKVAIAGLSEANDITVAIDTWFDTPGGGFETEGYQGDVSGFIERSVDASLKVEIPIRADDETLRDTLKAFAIGALAGEADVTISQDTRRALLRQSAEDLLSVGAPLAGARGRLGFIEAQIDEAATRNAAQETSYSIVRNTLVSADPFETATRLEAVQTQLETHFTLTARLSRLSLTEYLR